MKSPISLFLFLLVAFSVKAQNVVLSGVVSDSETGEPLLAATVRAGDKGISTDLEGRFTLSLSPDTHELIVSYVGFEPYEIEVDLSDGQEKFVDVSLEISDNLLKTAVITGSRFERSLEESIVSLDVLPNELLENTNTTNIETVLSKIPGVQILDGQPNIRGGSGWAYNAGNRVMVLIDDLPALQPDAGRAQWSDLPVENISQIEVIKGAGSTLYGSAAMNGVINIRTAYATSDPETQISLFHTRYDGYKDERKNWFDHTPQDFGLSASHKQKIGKWDIVAGAFYQKQDSTKTFRESDFRYKARGNLNLRYRATDRTTFGINTIVNKGRSSSFFLWKNGSTGALQPFAGTVTKSNNIRYTIDPYVTHYDKKDNRHRIKSRIYYNENDNNLNQSNTSTMFYNEYQFTRTFISSGINFSAGAVASFVDSDSEFFGNADVTHNNFATYVQLDKAFGDDFRISGGLRYEYHEQNNTEIQHARLTVPEDSRNEGRVIGRFGANYKVSDGTFLRMSWGQAYRYPILIERFLSTEFGGFVVLPNPDLVSEKGFTSEIGLKQGFQLGSLRGFIDIVGFMSRYEDMMEFSFVTEPLIGFKALNVGDTEISGFEFGVAANSTIFEIPIYIYGGYNYINPKYQDFTDQLRETSSIDENVLKYRSKHNFSLDVQADYRSFFLGMAINGASHVQAIDGILETFVPDLGGYRSVNNSGFQLFDMRFGYSFDKLKISFHVKNIFNEEYTLRPSLIEPPRNFAIRLDYKA